MMTRLPPLDAVVACASNNATILDANLRKSPAVASGRLPLHVERDAPSAAIAYNRALDATRAGIVILAHHDVFLPDGWDRLLALRIAEVERIDPDWGVIGPFGVGRENRMNYGPVWSSSIGMIAGLVPETPVPVQSFDELLLVLRRSSGLRFDETLPNFHLYGLDIAQTAWAAGKGAWTVPLPLVHNDRFHEALGEDFGQAYDHVRRKWRAHLPLNAPVVAVDRWGLALRKVRRDSRRSTAYRAALSVSPEVDPRVYAARCGWSDLNPSVDALAAGPGA
ncbi:MAG: hypothetical protein ACK4KW_02230 [Gemmobacter sp.]